MPSFEYNNSILNPASKDYVDAADALKVNKSGDTMTGALTIDQGASNAYLNIKSTSSSHVQTYAGSAGESARNIHINNVRRWKESIMSDGWTLMNFDSAGTLQGTVLNINNTTGLITVKDDPTTGLGIATKQYADLKLPLTGGTLSGSLSITRSTGLANLTINSGDNASYIVLNGAATTNRGVYIQTGALSRWYFGTNTSAETGSSAGSDLALYRYADAGTYVGSVIAFNRATGLGTVAGDPTTDLGIATKQYVDTADNLKLDLTGGELSGQLRIASGAEALQLKAGPTSDHVYMAFYADSASQTTRTGYFGVSNAGNYDITLVNQVTNGNILLNPNGTGRVVLNADPTTAMHAVTKQYADTKAPLASPALTGTPTAPTAATATNTTQIATTAFVQAVVDAEQTMGTMTAATNWAAYGGSWTDMYVTRYGNIVVCQAMMKTTTTVSVTSFTGTQIATVPSGFRPTHMVSASAFTNHNPLDPCRVEVDSSGNVRATFATTGTIASGAYFGFSLSWRAA